RVGTHRRTFCSLADCRALRQRSESPGSADAHLRSPWLAYRVRPDTKTDTPLPPDEPAGENPPDGAAIDYFLGKPSSQPVTLEIADSAGKLVRRYSSNEKPEQTQAELEKQLIPLYWLQPAT